MENLSTRHSVAYARDMLESAFLTLPPFSLSLFSLSSCHDSEKRYSPSPGKVGKLKARSSFSPPACEKTLTAGLESGQTSFRFSLSLKLIECRVREAIVDPPLPSMEHHHRFSPPPPFSFFQCS